MENTEDAIVPAGELEIAKIENRIVAVRGIPVILDRDLPRYMGLNLPR